MFNMASCSFGTATAAGCEPVFNCKDRRKRACEAMFCKEKQGPQHRWPLNAKIAAMWTTFVRTKRADFTPDSQSCLCYRHFELASYCNYGMYKQRLVKRSVNNICSTLICLIR